MLAKRRSGGLDKIVLNIAIIKTINKYNLLLELLKQSTILQCLQIWTDLKISKGIQIVEKKKKLFYKI